jgi:flagellin
MSSILTNNSAMNALSTLRNINNDLNGTQNRISTGLKISSGKDNAAYFSISETMKGDSGMFSAINESLTLTKNSISTGRLGAENVADLANQFVERVAFAQANPVEKDKVADELKELVSRIGTTIAQATFNGDSMVDGTGSASDTFSVVTGVSRANGALSTTSISISKVNLDAVKAGLSAVANGFSGTAAELQAAEAQLSNAIDAATTLGIAEKSIETQQEFLTELSDRLDGGVGAMVDANMEEEAARLQSLQVQQQLATQSLSIANQAPQNILSLFR